MTKIFISYSSKDRAIVDELAADLDLLLNDAVVWYDSELNRSGGQQWWNLILEEIRACDVFIYALSPHVLKSEPCRREYGYAQALNKPILPLAISEIKFHDLSVELQILQLVNFQTRDRQQQKSLKASILNLPSAPPLPPNAKDLAPAAPLDPAGVLFDRIARLTSDSDQQRLLLLDIEDLHDEDGYRKFVPELLTRLLDRDDVLTARNMKRAEDLQVRLDTSHIPVAPLAKTVASVLIHRSNSIDLMPAPFAWIDIPGKIGKNWTSASYKIAKYPVTNAQFAKFIEEGGYEQQKWWSEEGWKQREEGRWRRPRFWTNITFRTGECPVVGVSWFEALAFCIWLSDITNEKIMLPTEEQWQYAAQGDDGRNYPWGNDWDNTKCRNSIDGGLGGVVNTNPVTQYEGKGDSFFGAVDMAGNTWEWCITDYEKKSNDFNQVAKNRVLRGGSYYGDNSERFRCGSCFWEAPSYRVVDIGFRLTCS